VDNELFELCKEVYEKTRWQIENPSFFGVQYYGSPFETELMVTTDQAASFQAPLYTSDYLLEKLPRNIGSYGLEMWSYPSDDGVAFGYYDTLAKRWHQTIPQRGDRLPLKALLKLTIALHEAGELKGNSL